VQALPVVKLVNAPAVVMAGQQSLSLQLNSRVIYDDYTGWRVQLKQPDNSTVELGAMDWGSVDGVIHTWKLNIPGSQLTQVSTAGFPQGGTFTTM
jgi:hypothetical protein